MSIAPMKLLSKGWSTGANATERLSGEVRADRVFIARSLITDAILSGAQSAPGQEEAGSLECGADWMNEPER